MTSAVVLTACGSSVDVVPAELAAPGGAQPLPATVPAAPGVTPTALRIPSIKVDASDWQMVGVDKDQAIEVPSVKTPQKLGLYCPTWKATKETCGAPIPGARGPAVVLGHVNGGGKNGVFAHLAEVKSGDVVEIDRSDNRTVRFRVDRVQIVKKSEFPSKSVYSDTSGAELRLITCGGGDNRLETLPDGTRSYVNQTIVFASLTT